MTQSFQEAIQSFISQTLVGETSKDGVAADADLLSTELIDSIGVMQLVTFIETQLGVLVPAQDVTFDNFVTIDAICQYLWGRVATGDTIDVAPA